MYSRLSPASVGASQSCPLFHRFGPDAVIPMVWYCAQSPQADAGNRGLHALADNYSPFFVSNPIFFASSSMLARMPADTITIPASTHFPCFQAGHRLTWPVSLDGFTLTPVRITTPALDA